MLGKARVISTNAAPSPQTRNGTRSLKTCKRRPSQSANCWDNAVMERFFLNLKMERVWHKDYANHLEATNDIADYIVGFYNAVRLHSKLGNLSPNAFEPESTSDKPIKLSEIT